MDGGVVTFILAILIVAVLVFVAILLTGKRGYHFNVEAYQSKFLAIENKLKQENPATFMTTIIEADKLLDFISKLSSLSSSTTLQSISKLTEQYDGVKLGFDLKK